MIFSKSKSNSKNDTTLNAGEIQQKLEEQGIRISNSPVTKAFEKQENTITKNRMLKQCF